LSGFAYSWYRTNNAGTFTSWSQNRVAFLRQYQPETGQQQALAALDKFRQDPTEDISTYSCRFCTLCNRWVGNLLNDDTLKWFFICGFDKVSTIESINSRRPTTLEDAIRVALEIEAIQKENERMVRRAHDPILSYIHVYHRPEEQTQYHHISNNRYTGNSGALSGHPTPLAIKEPAPLLTYYSGIDQLYFDVK
jgi:hypothetical protein